MNALQIIHEAVRKHVQNGDFCIDATAGRGNDTLFLSNLVGNSGHVAAFDIQPEAIASTENLLRQHEKNNFTLYCESHAKMKNYFPEETISCIMFNFGWLPKGRHDIFTKAETSLSAVEQGLHLLRSGGLMTLILYYGRENGFSERDALLEYLPTLDSNCYTVLEMPFVNRKNCPPIPILIWKEK